MSERKVALVTGANKGLGFEICRQLANREYLVFLTARSRPSGVEACARLCQDGAEVRFVELDVTSHKGIRAAADAVAVQTDHLDVLVNNAGICGDPNSSVLDIAPEVVLRTLETNTVGPLLVAQAFWPLLAKSQGGRIINVSSGLGALSDMSSGFPSYRISKAGLNALTRVLAAELKSKNIAVNSASPGWVRTDMGGPSAELSVEEGADSIVWLATEAPASLTGQFVADRKTIEW